MTRFALRLLCLALAAALSPRADVRAADAQPLPPVYLSHLYVVLDPTSYDAIVASPVLSALADTRLEHVDASNGSWSGAYITGKHTYIELFSGKQPPPESAEGRSGAGLQVETAGGVQAIAGSLRAAFGDRVTVDEEKFKHDDGRMLRAFTAVAVEPATTPPALELWVMESDPDYLRIRHPETPMDDPLTRLRYNAWRYQPALPFEDVTGIRVAASPADLEELERQLRAVGWAIERRDQGFVARGPDITFDVVPARARSGIQQLTLHMARAVSQRRVELGHARLDLDGTEGHLIFWADD